MTGLTWLASAGALGVLALFFIRPQLGIIAARLVQPYGLRRRVQVAHGQEEFLGSLVPLVHYLPAPLLSSRRSHATPIFQSRSTDRSDTSSIRDVSWVVIPPKIRYSTTLACRSSSTRIFSSDSCSDAVSRSRFPAS